jgi:hypothetical protein
VFGDGGIVNFDPWGRCLMSAAGNTLVVRVEATDPENLQRIQETVTRDLERFGQRDHLIVRWQSPDELSAHPTEADTATNPPPRHSKGQHETRGRADYRTLLLTTGGALGIALIVAGHLTLAGAVVAVPGWLGWTAAGLIVLPASMVVLHAVVPLTARAWVATSSGAGEPRIEPHSKTGETANEDNPTSRRHDARYQAPGQ